MASVKYNVGDKVGNFVIISEYKRYKKHETDKKVTRFIVAKCLFCDKEKIGEVRKLNDRSVVCECDKKPKYKTPTKDYTNEIHGNYKITKDLGWIPDAKVKLGRSRQVICECIKCKKQTTGKYYVFKNLKRNCVCQKITGVQGDRKRIYQIYSHMMNRCHNKENARYKSYGAKGISVCDEWQHDREKFYIWSLENNYDESLSIDRIDGSLGYSPENCRWATKSEQVHNRKVSLNIEVVKDIKKRLLNGEKQIDIARLHKTTSAKVSNIKTGTSYSTINIE